MNRIELDIEWALEKRFTLKQWASWLQRTMATALYGSANPSKEVGSTMRGLVSLARLLS